MYFAITRNCGKSLIKMFYILLYRSHDSHSLKADENTGLTIAQYLLKETPRQFINFQDDFTMLKN